MSAGRLRGGPVALVVAAALLVAAALAGAAGHAGQATRHLTGSDLLARAYASILDADFERAARDTAEACGPAPKEACQLMALTAERWQIELDLDNRARDARLLTRIGEAIVATEAWSRREPGRAEAWFYLGVAYGMRAQMHGIRLERFAAARDGTRIKAALERALAIDPGLADAHFGIGLYRYLAGVVPAPVRLLLWLLMLPGGDRVTGLQEMLAAREHGELLRGEADFQMHWYYLWYEHQPEQALSLLEGLRARYPRNPIFMWRIAEVQDASFHDLAASRDMYRSLVEAAASGGVGAPYTAGVRGRLGLAEQEDALYESDRAIELLGAVIAARPAAPYGALARAHYLLGVAQDRLGRRGPAVEAYRAAIAAAPPDDPAGVRDLARKHIGRASDAKTADAYRLSLEGWRLVERGALADAAAPLARSLELDPADPVARFRLGLFYQARGEHGRARAEFERTLAARPLAPPTFLAAAYVEMGRALEREAQPERATEMYRAATRIRGAEARTLGDARAALVRLRAVTAAIAGAATRGPRSDR